MLRCVAPLMLRPSVDRKPETAYYSIKTPKKEVSKLITLWQNGSSHFWSCYQFGTHLDLIHFPNTNVIKPFRNVKMLTSGLVTSIALASDGHQATGHREGCHESHDSLNMMCLEWRDYITDHYLLGLA